jgi:hypothetical protein
VNFLAGVGIWKGAHSPIPRDIFFQLIFLSFQIHRQHIYIIFGILFLLTLPALDHFSEFGRFTLVGLICLQFVTIANNPHYLLINFFPLEGFLFFLGQTPLSHFILGQSQSINFLNVAAYDLPIDITFFHAFIQVSPFDLKHNRPGLSLPQPFVDIQVLYVCSFDPIFF